MRFRNKTIVVIGSGKSGIAAAHLAYAQKAQVIISDHQKISLTEIESHCDSQKDADFLRALHKGEIVLESQGHKLQTIQKADLIVVSPGVPENALVLQWAKDNQVPVWGEIEWAWRFCSSLVIAVTGSNGKTTTATLIQRVLKSTGKKIALCGNIGLPFSSCVLDKTYDIFVIELSSFQLEHIETFRPDIAVMTNFSQNHLDRHFDLQAYFDAKKRVFMNQTSQDTALLNAQDEWSMKLRPHLKAAVVLFNPNESPMNANDLIAWEVGRIFGVSDTDIKKELDSFSGVSHRLEKVQTIDGVIYVNDSKSTTVESGRWAVRQMHQPTILMVGGSDKNLDYSSLRELIQKKVKHVVAFGAIREQFFNTFSDIVNVDLVEGSFLDVMNHVRGIACEGDCVLFSPMTASFDMFKNFEHRGDEFKKIIMQWSQESK